MVVPRGGNFVMESAGHSSNGSSGLLIIWKLGAERRNPNYFISLEKYKQQFKFKITHEK